MHLQAKIQKWGNGLGMRISGVLRDIPHFHEGDLIQVEVSAEGFTVKKIPPAVKRFYSEEELLRGITSYHGHADLSPTLLDSEKPE